MLVIMTELNENNCIIIIKFVYFRFTKGEYEINIIEFMSKIKI